MPFGAARTLYLNLRSIIRQEHCASDIKDVEYLEFVQKYFLVVANYIIGSSITENKRLGET